MNDFKEYLANDPQFNEGLKSWFRNLRPDINQNNKLSFESPPHSLPAIKAYLNKHNIRFKIKKNSEWPTVKYYEFIINGEDIKIPREYITNDIENIIEKSRQNKFKKPRLDFPFSPQNLWAEIKSASDIYSDFKIGIKEPYYDGTRTTGYIISFQNYEILLSSRSSLMGDMSNFVKIIYKTPAVNYTMPVDPNEIKKIENFAKEWLEKEKKSYSSFKKSQLNAFMPQDNPNPAVNTPGRTQTIATND